MLPGLGAGVSYAAYTEDLAVSGWPWKIGVFVTLVCFSIPFIVALLYRRSNLMWVCGVILTTSMFSLYYFFGIFAYFCYFIFAPLPLMVQSIALLGGTLLTLYWGVISTGTVKHLINRTPFVKKAFDEEETHFTYRMQAGTALCERLLKERSPFPKIYVYFAYGVAPFSLIGARLLSSSFGTNGLLFFLAVLGMPMSLWSAGLLARVFLMYIVLPKTLEKDRDKPVVVAE
ncbi:hypothetical protein [Paraburkholderia sp. BCC1886]|uniref:hypothetical protein n=1 Tax=Paraburkholderia sp. BCC1886 TaxID=2562670 RepID=UPI0021B2EC5C|nr:hypothetical protein [Paraburkholderia sp. BCC1886]